ncbi:hypothetical protein ACS5PK_22295 [Roseateles sp. DB2]|uniref:hypothetical protein n=1 Tax=Roseateles sp. DB2 TaxID=3453717 RepID=UPI003EE83DB2
MHVLRHAHEVEAFIDSHPGHSGIELLQQRQQELLADEDVSMEELIFYVITEAADGPQQIESAIHGPLCNPEGRPLWEVIEEHEDCFEMVFVLASSGYGAIVVVPEQDSHPDLLALCRSHVTARPEGGRP